MPTKDENVIAFTRSRAAELSGLSLRQLDYWRKTHLFEPSTSEQLSPYRAVHLYDFADMLELLTIAQLLDRDVPTKRIRKIVDRMRAQGVQRPLSEIKYGVAKRRPRKDGKPGRLLVIITFEDGTTEGDDHPGQMIVEGTVDVSEIRATLRRSTDRAADSVGQIERRRNTLGSKELFKGTRIPVATVRRYLTEGVPVGEILEAFPALKVEDVEAVHRVS
jgi:DNA-binding transcriptional MerR regulator